MSVKFTLKCIELHNLKFCYRGNMTQDLASRHAITSTFSKIICPPPPDMKS